MKIGVLDYGAGNLRSVCRALEHLKYGYELVSTEKDIMTVDKLIIPGVGAFKVAMAQLHRIQVVEPIRELAKKGTPILGICLGMQLLFDKSYEFGETKGLGLIDGEINLIPELDEDSVQHKIPHIGWNELIVDLYLSPMVAGLEKDDSVYFVHSFRAELPTNENLVAHAKYGGLLIPAIVAKENVVGCQFHPEKSGSIGLSILRNFLVGIV